MSRNKLLGLLLPLVVVGLFMLNARGEDMYSGTWQTANTRGIGTLLTIERDGRGWAITDQLGHRMEAVEVRGGRIEIETERAKGMTLQRDGDLLILRSRSDERVADYRRKGSSQ